MKERRIISGLIYLLLSVSFVCGVRQTSAFEAKDAEETVCDMLARNGLQAGFCPERKAVIEVVSHEIKLKDCSQLNESTRSKAVSIAYLRAVGSIAEKMGQQLESTTQEPSIGITMRTSMRSCTNVYSRVMLQAESCMTETDHVKYMAAIAVVSSEKLSRTMVAAMNGDIEGMSEFKGGPSLKEWMDNGIWNHLGPQIVHDAPRHFWILGIASQEVDDELDKNALRGKAAYAAECALGGNVNVELEQTSFLNRSDKVQEFSEENLSDHSCHLFVRDSTSVFEERIKLTPFLQVNPWSGKIKWFERDEKNPMTGKRIRIAVAAIDSNDIPSFVRNGSSNVFGKSQQETSTSAIEQAKNFIESKGWRTGRDFAVSNKFAVSIGGAAFKYTPSMDGAVFAQKRNDAVRQALMESAMNVAFTFGCRGDLKMSLSSGDSKMQQSYVADDEAGEKIVRGGISFCDDSDTVVDFKSQGFTWLASFSSLSAESSESERKSVKKVEGRVKSEMPIRGLKVERQFESIVDGVYQIAFVVTCNPKRGMDMVLNEKNHDERGKLPLGQWIAEQDFGMVAGPRQYVDDNGYVWMIGIAPAAEGCRPFGSLLDGIAREYAAFGLSGDVKASYATSSLKGSSGEYSERKAEILYSAAQSPIGKNYPKEFELVFHRAFIHPLTGRRGEVSICALRSGTRAAVEKLVAEQIKENQARAKEHGRKQGVRDSLLRMAKGQFQ